MYNRKIYRQLAEWKNSENKKPLVIKGVRQCGKTTTVKEFASKNYKNVIYIDFKNQKELKHLFDGSLQIDYLTTLISASIPGARFIQGESCIIFDEIQDCPAARLSLKYWKTDGRYDVICTGSLLGVSGYNEDSIPVGYEKIINMYPMDFEEWLWANGVGQPAIDILKESLKNETPVPEALHMRMRQLLLEYIIVGGMPEAVQTFLKTHDVNQTLDVQRDIVSDYEADMVKYVTASEKAKIRECFESIPAQLAKENKKFQYSVVKAGGRSKEYLGSIQWIEDAGIAHRCYNLSITELPLEGNAIKDEFKLYMTDTGLFVSMLEPGTQGDILQGKLLTYKGAIYENLMADILTKMGRKLYYFHKQDSIELDFVIRYKGECLPIECKARTGKTRSVKAVLANKEKYHVLKAIKLGDHNIGRQDNLLTLPFYLGFLLTEA